MNLYFKVDKKERLILMFCGKLKIKSKEKSFNIFFNRHTESKSVNSVFTKSVENFKNKNFDGFKLPVHSPKNFKKFKLFKPVFICNTCLREFKESSYKNFIEIPRRTLKQLHEYFQENFNSLLNIHPNLENSIGTIPIPLLNSEPLLEEWEIKQKMKDVVYLFTNIKICKVCYKKINAL